jgi:hypothetical protein
MPLTVSASPFTKPAKAPPATMTPAAGGPPFLRAVAASCRVLPILRNGCVGARQQSSPDSPASLPTPRTEDLVRVVREGGEHRNGAKTSHHTFEVIQALAESARRGGIVELPLPREGRDPLGELLSGR